MRVEDFDQREGHWLLPDIRRFVRAHDALPDETAIDGEVVALDQNGRPSFNALQNLGSAGATLVYYVFDLMILGGREVMAEPLDGRRALLEASDNAPKRR